MLSIVVCADDNLGIGYNNELLIHIPEDMKFFKDLTISHKIIMGYNTAMSLPGSKPLPGRENLVLTRDHINDLPEGFKAIDSNYIIPQCVESDEEIFVIGGASVYKFLMPYSEKIYMTKVQKKFENVDAYFPPINGATEWYARGWDKTLHCSKNDVDFNFMTFTRRKGGN